MRRISILISSLVTSFALALSGLVFSPANASAPADGTYTCGDGTYKITTVNSVITFGEARTCTGPLVIPEGVEATENYIFNYYADAKVTSVSLPESLYQMGHSGFYGTGLLTEINVASNNAAFTSVDGVLFSLRPDGESASLYAYPANKDGSTYTTPTSVSFAGGSPIPVTTIEGYAFQGAKNLTTLNISQGVTTLGYGIAASSTLLSTINLPDSYTNMTGYPFGGAEGLTSLAIGAFLTSIPAGAFYQTGNLNSITVDDDNPNYSARDGVLFDNGQLNQLKLHTYPSGKNEPNYIVPDDVTHIESSAFNSTKVKTLSIPKSVSNIGLGVFENASALTSFTVAGDNDDFSAIDGVLFNKPPTKLIAYPIANTANTYAIPSGAEIIGNSAFMSASNLTSVVIPSSVSTFENSAFFCATSLTKFYFLGNAPTSDPLTCLGGEPKAYVKNANASSFTLVDGKWNGLTVSEFDHFVNFDSKGGSAVSLSSFVTGGNVSAPTAPTRTGYGFTGWSITDSVADGGTAVAFPYTPSGDITLFANWFRDGNYFCSTGQWTEETTDTYMISGGVVSNGGTCTGNVVIPEGANSIGANAFQASAMTSISLPATLTSIGEYAFASSTSLDAISIPYGVVSIGEWAFSSSELLETINLPASVTSIGNTAFQDSLSLKNINVNSANTNFASVDGVLFNKALTQLEAYPAGKPAASYTVPASVEVIDDRSFISSNALKTVLFTSDSQLTSLVGSVFQTSGLTSIVLPEGVETIGSAFSYATNLTSVTIPASVTDIGGYAFQGSTKLSSFYFLGAPPTVDPLTFTNIGPAPKAFMVASLRPAFGGLGSNWNGLTVAMTYTLTYTYNSATGGNTVASSSFATGDTAITLPTPTRTGYTFAGWYSNSGLTTKIGNAGANYSPTGTTATLSAYAKWTSNRATATVKPTVSGTAKVGKTLTAKDGTWTGSPTPSVTRQWYACKTAVTGARSTVPSNCTKISGATGKSLKLAKAQEGKYITVLVTGISAGTTKTTSLAKSTGKVK